MKVSHTFARLAICSCLWASLRADFDASGLALKDEGIGYEPTTGRWKAENRILFIGLDTLFDAQWTEWHRWRAEGDGSGTYGPEVIYNFEDDFDRVPFREGSPLDDLTRCGLRMSQSGDTSLVCYNIQIALCENDEVALTFKAFDALPDDRLFAVKLYGAEWVRPWDDVPGLHRRSLPNGFVLRCKNSHPELNAIRLAPDSRCFAVEIQGPGIDTENPESYASFVGFYYLPKPSQPLYKKDCQRTLLKEVLPEKLRAFQRNLATGASLPTLDQLLSSLMSPPRPPRREVPRGTTPDLEHIPHFADAPVRQSWLYQSSGRPSLEAVYVHAYNDSSGYGSLLLANLIWDERAKGEELERICSSRFNIDALPLELQNFLFDPHAPFAKVRIQINIQCYMIGQKQIEITMPDGNKQKEWKPDPTQCLRPHYAVANMPCANTAGRDKLCPAVVGGLFAMRLYGTYFMDNPPDKGTPHFPRECLPAGFDLRAVSTHEQWAWDRAQRKNVLGGCWVASPNNCQIANTDDHNISQSFYSVVMGKCMQYYNDYRDVSDRRWDDEVTAIVTLHIVLQGDWRSGGDITIVRPNTTGSLSETAKKCYDTWAANHQSDAVKHKNPFEEFYNLCRADGSLARTRPRR